MKANELMINDWVYEGSNHAIKVKQNYGKSISYEEDKYSHEVEESCLLPIPLTEEILEKNGFILENDETTHTEFLYGQRDVNGYKKPPCVFITHGKFIDEYHIDVYGRYVMVKGNFIRYVHEFQHALRLCGLNELADNFKV